MIKNTPKDHGPEIDALRSAFEHRATWFYFLVDEAEKRGLDPDDFARAAITRCGKFHGSLKTPTDSLVEYSNEVCTGNGIKIFDMERNISEDAYEIKFHYCPLVAAWQKLTDDEEKIAHLCDIAMDGDRGIASCFPDFEFHLGKTIAQGNDVCELLFTKKKK